MVCVDVLALLLLGFGYNTFCLVNSLIYSGGDGFGFVLVKTLLYRSSLGGVPVERDTRWSTVYQLETRYIYTVIGQGELRIIYYR